MPDEATVIYRLGQLRQRLAFQYGRLTYAGNVHPDRRLVSEQRYDHIVKAQLHYQIRDLDALLGIEDPQFAGNAFPPPLRWPPLRRRPKRSARRG